MVCHWRNPVFMFLGIVCIIISQREMAPLTLNELEEVECPPDRPALCFRNGFCCYMHQFCDSFRRSCEPCFPNNWSEDKQRQFCLTSQNVSELNDPTCAGACLSKYGPSATSTPQRMGSADSDWWPWLFVGATILLLFVCGALVVKMFKQRRVVSKKPEDRSQAPPTDDDGFVMGLASERNINNLRSFSDGDIDGSASNEAAIQSSARDPLLGENGEAIIVSSEADIHSFVNSSVGDAQQRTSEREQEIPLSEMGAQGPRTEEAGVQRARPDNVERQPLTPRADTRRNMSFHMSEANGDGPSCLATTMGSRE